MKFNTTIVVVNNEALTDNCDILANFVYDYSSVVKYPFGYGLSYSQFEWSDYSLKESDGGYDASVTVKNVGDVAGKDVVQLYVQAPYTSGGVEKASVVLAGYAKTDELKPGDKHTVNIHFDKADFASYDYDELFRRGIKLHRWITGNQKDESKKSWIWNDEHADDCRKV